MQIILKKRGLILGICFLYSSCWIYYDSNSVINKRVNTLDIVEEVKLYSGWWIYGEGSHFFKDENTLLEWSIYFPNEEEGHLEELYLAICEMEFFPMESIMKGHLKNDTLVVESFEILYIQGCGE